MEEGEGMSSEGKRILDLRRYIPSVSGCPKDCHRCCGPVPFSRWERSRIKDKRTAKGIACPYVGKSGCEIYEDRPILCRLFGTSGMPLSRRCEYHVQLKEVRIKNVIDAEKSNVTILSVYQGILNKSGAYGPFAEMYAATVATTPEEQTA
jgi:Fe-S-cluster containining protein